MGSPRKSPTKKRRVARPSAHPTSSVMVQAAIAALKERRGSSLAAIKKYIAANYKCDMTRRLSHLDSCCTGAVVVMGSWGEVPSIMCPSAPPNLSSPIMLG